jgi:hypothetical protein
MEAQVVSLPHEYDRLADDRLPAAL